LDLQPHLCFPAVRSAGDGDKHNLGDIVQRLSALEPGLRFPKLAMKHLQALGCDREAFSSIAAAGRSLDARVMGALVAELSALTTAQDVLVVDWPVIRNRSLQDEARTLAAKGHVRVSA
jgi:hypothetical protein